MMPWPDNCGVKHLDVLMRETTPLSMGDLSRVHIRKAIK
jgi:hypothetical protein